MTLQELSQLYHIKREIEKDTERLAEMRARAFNRTGNLTGVTGGGYENRIERICAEIVDLDAIITAKLTLCIHERNRLERYINDIPDSLTRRIFLYRFVDGYSWRRVARELGEGYTDDAVKQRFYRYIKKK